jgi:hypothetical protein
VLRLTTALLCGLALALAALGSAAPARACAADGGPECLPDANLVTLRGMVWQDANADARLQADETVRFQDIRVYLDLNGDAKWSHDEPDTTTGADGRYTLSFPQELVPQTQTRLLRIEQSFPGRCTVPEDGCTYTEHGDPAEDGGGRDFAIATAEQLYGWVYEDVDGDGRRGADERGLGATAHVWLDENDNGVRDGSEQQSSAFDADGGPAWWSLVVPPDRIGKPLPPVRIETRRGWACMEPRGCAVRGLQARSGTVKQEFGINRPILIFLHGYGGSEISCPEGNLWFGPVRPNLAAMRLMSDGETAAPSTCSQPAAPSGLLRSVGGGLADVYGGPSDHYKSLVEEDRFAEYAWDWRKRPSFAVDGLDRLIDRLRCGGPPPCERMRSKRVVVVAHSMGGLVLREYINDPQRADKVERAVTLGTPFWGSAKAIFPTTIGQELPGWSKMDPFLNNAQLKKAVQNFGGHYALFPSYAYGPWLTVDGMNDNKPLDVDEVHDYVRQVGGNEALAREGTLEHYHVLDHFEDNGVDLQLVVSQGVPTIRSVAIHHRTMPLDPDSMKVLWDSGDGTVAAFASAHDAPADRVHYVCGLDHGDLQADPQTTTMIDGWLVDGRKIDDPHRECEWGGFQTEIFYPQGLEPRRAQAAAAPAGALTLDEAERQGRAQVIDLPDRTLVMTDQRDPVTLALPQGAAVAVRSVGAHGEGPEQRFGPVPAGATLASGATAAGVRTRAGAAKRVRADRTPPVSRISVRPAGPAFVVLRVRARDASRVARIDVRIGKRVVRYRKPLRVRRSQLRSVRVSAVDIWGNAERPRAVSDQRGR